MSTTRVRSAGTRTPSLAAYAELLATYLGPHARQVTWLAVLLLSTIGLQVFSPQLLGRFIDGALGADEQRQLLATGGLFLAASLLQQVLLIGATYSSERIAWTTTNALRADLARHCLGLDPDFHATHTPGELIERIDGDVTTVASFFSQFVVQVIGNVLLLVGILLMLWTFDWRVGAVLTTFALGSLALMLHTRAVAVPYYVRFRETSARLFGFIEEHLVGLEDLRALGAEGHVLRRLSELAGRRLQAARWARLLSSVPWSMPLVLSAAGFGLTYVLLALLVGGGSLTVGAAFTVYFYLRVLFVPMTSISGQLEEFQRATAGIVRIQELRSLRSRLHDPEAPKLLPDGALSAQLQGIEFGYRADEPVLRDVSFSLPACRSLGLVGRTGSGKTTITRLLVRMWDPWHGNVHVGGLDVRSVERAALRRRVGVVTQQPHLFGASVRDNLSLFDPEITDAAIWLALEQLGLAEWIAALPDGLATVLGVDGRGLSAGEAQLLAATRVLLRDPGLVILDEPSSRLDPTTERLVHAAMQRLLAGRTGIIIAHRLATLEHVDEVLVLDRGRVVEHGPRHQLRSDLTSRFAHLLSAEGVTA